MSGTSASSAREVVGPSVGQGTDQQGHLRRRCCRSPASWPTSHSVSSSASRVGAIVATIHDLLVTLAFLVVLRLRHDAQRHRRAADHHRLSRPTTRSSSSIACARTCGRCGAIRSITSSTSRSIRRWAAPSSPSGTAFLSSLALLLFGGEVLHGFAVHDGRRHHHRHVFDACSSPPRSSACGAARGRPGPRRARRRPPGCRPAAARTQVEAAAEGAGLVTALSGRPSALGSQLSALESQRPAAET